LAAGRERALGKEVLSQRLKILIMIQFEFRLESQCGPRIRMYSKTAAIRRI
jgi:hypothetical protein